MQLGEGGSEKLVNPAHGEGKSCVGLWSYVAPPRTKNHSALYSLPVMIFLTWEPALATT